MNYQDQLDRASFAVRDKIGQVLSSGSVIINMRDRAQNFTGTSSDAVNETATAVVSKANGLLEQYKSIEADSQALLAQADTLRGQMSTSPAWQQINSVYGFANAGTAVAGMIGKAVSLTSQLATVTRRADQHLADVETLKQDETNLENFAQGKGLRAVVSGIGSAASGIGHLAGSYLNFAKYAAIGIGLFFVWDIAKPLITAKRAAR